MRCKTKLVCTDFVTETLDFFNIVFPGQYLKEVLNILTYRQTLPVFMYISVVLVKKKKNVVTFNVLTDSREIKN